MELPLGFFCNPLPFVAFRLGGCLSFVPIFLEN
jgi:hypothetical protein